MASSKKAIGRRAKASSSDTPPQPFKRAPGALAPFSKTLSKEHVYIAHIDSKPSNFKKKIFLVPVLLNVSIVLLFMWRAYHAGPYYFKLLATTLGYPNEATVVAADSSWASLAKTVLRRSLTFLLDFILFVFVWPWPVEFCLGQAHGNPVSWRWNVGFRDKEIYVRRSRTWDRGLGDVVANPSARTALLSTVATAISPMYLQEKTGYLTMNGQWDLDWAAMVHATSLIDEGTLTLDAFQTLVLAFHEDYGWMCLDTRVGENAQEDERRRQVLAFRDALASVGKEDLFFRWIEIVQFEASRPGGFGPEKQDEVAKSIRDLFASEGVDFDDFWKQSVGSEGPAGM
ncbi:KRR1 small subunit processome component protein [Pleurostoma richardsiae]|uniref:KRR1 small subunit processome component protein n=1 Tax=Pleurostoma richardsiae TaxID=41990 RepID=A0AA38RUG0_9PEZI|nr:KRR1 small subunit processome component protein [Pleurostoma richardsiae]